MQVDQVSVQVDQVSMQIEQVRMQIEQVRMQIVQVSMQIYQVSMQIGQVSMQTDQVVMQIAQFAGSKTTFRLLNRKSADTMLEVPSLSQTLLQLHFWQLHSSGWWPLCMNALSGHDLVSIYPPVSQDRKTYVKLLYATA